MRFTKVNLVFNALHERHTIATVHCHTGFAIILIADNKLYLMSLLEDAGHRQHMNIVFIELASLDGYSLCPRIDGM